MWVWWSHPSPQSHSDRETFYILQKYILSVSNVLSTNYLLINLLTNYDDPALHRVEAFVFSLAQFVFKPPN